MILMTWIGEVYNAFAGVKFRLNDVLRSIMITNEAIPALGFDKSKFQLVACAAIIINEYLVGRWTVSIQEKDLSTLSVHTYSASTIARCAYAICSLRLDSLFMELPSNIPISEQQYHIYTPEFLTDPDVFSKPKPTVEDVPVFK